MIHRAIIAVALLVLLAGCASAKKSYRQAHEAETEGRWAQAAEQYIDALRRDPEYPGAREKAHEAGNRAIAEYLEVARGFEYAGRYEPAVGEYEKIDRLADLAASVRVVLQLPSDYDARRSATLARAIEDAFGNADRLVAEGRWRDAHDEYQRIQRRFRLSAREHERAQRGQLDALIIGATGEMSVGHFDRAESIASSALNVFGPASDASQPARDLLDVIDARRYDALLVSAEVHLAEGRYQVAYGAVSKAIDLYGVASPEAADAVALRDRILDAGTVFVVATPVTPDRKLAGRVPDALLDDLDRILEDDYWTAPPLFVAMAEPGVVRGELRRFDLDGETLSPQRAAAIAGQLQGDLVATFTVDQCAAGSDGDAETREVVHADGRSVHVALFPLRSARARCVYRLISVPDGQVLHESRFEATASRPYPHAVYEGDLDELLLTRTQHAWFDDRARHETDRAMESEIAMKLADQISQDVFYSVLAHLP